MATHTGWRAVVMLVQQSMAVWAVFELRQLIGRQRRIEIVHHGGIGMAARAELNDPGAIFLSIFLRPFFHMRVPQIGSRIATVTTGTRQAATKMNILNNFYTAAPDS